MRHIRHQTCWPRFFKRDLPVSKMLFLLILCCSSEPAFSPLIPLFWRLKSFLGDAFQVKRASAWRRRWRGRMNTSGSIWSTAASPTLWNIWIMRSRRTRRKASGYVLQRNFMTVWQQPANGCWQVEADRRRLLMSVSAVLCERLSLCITRQTSQHERTAVETRKPFCCVDWRAAVWNTAGAHLGLFSALRWIRWSSSCSSSFRALTCSAWRSTGCTWTGVCSAGWKTSTSPPSTS